MSYTVPSRPASIGSEKKFKQMKDFNMKEGTRKVREQNKRELILCVTIILKFGFSRETLKPVNQG